MVEGSSGGMDPGFKKVRAFSFGQGVPGGLR